MKIIYDKLRHKEAHYVCILLINMLTATKFSTFRKGNKKKESSLFLKNNPNLKAIKS